jgi:2-polyprenyl-3-methyl-5-hydroxy-6-metoxy-1,4-benzoquinol methylase
VTSLSRKVSSEEQVEIEAELAQVLARASPDQRAKLYGPVYDRIYDMHLSRNPQTLDFGAGPELLGFLDRLTRTGDDVLEVGCGGGLLAIEMARRGRRVLAVDVSERILGQARRRAEGASGVRFAVSSGIEIPARNNSFDFAFSVEVLEHLHAEDVARHAREVHRVLRPGGRYWILTPNRLDSIGSAERFGVGVDASHDVHLKEWTYGELNVELHRAGFASLRSPWRNTRALRLPLLPVSWFAAVERFPSSVLRHRRVRWLSGIIACSIVATKSR